MQMIRHDVQSGRAQRTWIALAVMSLAVATLTGCSSSSNLSSASTTAAATSISESPPTTVAPTAVPGTAPASTGPASTGAASTTPAPPTPAPTSPAPTTAPAAAETIAPQHPAPSGDSPSTTAAEAATPPVPTTLAPAGSEHCPVGGEDVIRLGDGVGFGCESVRHVQELLTSNGYPVPADGEFGPGTDSAVRAFQTDNHLDVDGLVGPATWDILNGFGGDY